jgi:hypothetical protein
MLEGKLNFGFSSRPLKPVILVSPVHGLTDFSDNIFIIFPVNEIWYLRYGIGETGLI